MTAILSWLIGSTPGRLLIGAVAFFVWLQFHDAKVADRAREGYVRQVEKVAAEARAAEEERQRRAAEQSLEEFRRRLESTRAEEERTSKELQDALIQNEQLRKARPAGSGLDDDDVDFILCQRKGAPARCRGRNDRPGIGAPKPPASSR